jgi:hypothetical protein
MKQIQFTTTANGWITSNSKELGSVMGRTTTCKGCGYVQKTILPSRYDTKLWRETHTLEFCKNKKAENAFAKMFDNAEDALASLSIIK